MDKNNLPQSSLFFRAGMLALAAGMGIALPAVSGVVDRPSMKYDGVVIVWAADDSSNAPIASDFIIQDSGNNTDLIAGNVSTVLTGTLVALDEDYADDAGATLRIQRIDGGPDQTTRNGDRVTDANDSFTPFALQATTDVRTIRSDIESSFYVASNKGFNIDAIATTPGPASDLNLIRLRMRTTRAGTDDGLGFGSAAQYPHTGNNRRAGVQIGNWQRLSTLTSTTTVFSGNRKTARIPGTIAEQSVRFDQTYRWNTGNIDLSQGVFDVEAEVEYTVYIP